MVQLSGMCDDCRVANIALRDFRVFESAERWSPKPRQTLGGSNSNGAPNQGART